MGLTVFAVVAAVLVVAVLARRWFSKPKPGPRREPDLQAPKPAARPAPSVPRFIAFDVETANGDRASICQVGIAVVARDGTIETHSTLVDPEVPFANTHIHGITAMHVAGAPTWPDVLAAFAPMLSRVPIVQHSPFDKAAVAAACTAHGLPTPGWQWIDSLSIARRAWPELKGNGGHGLASLKQHLKLEFTHHHAEEDARAAALVVLHAEAHTGLDFITVAASPATPRQPRSSRTRDPLSSAERSSLLSLISALDSVPAPDPAAAEELRQTHFREVHVGMRTGLTFGQASGSILSPYFSAPDPKAAIRGIDDDLIEQIRLVRGLLDAWLTHGELVPPHYAGRIAIILRKAKEDDLEQQFLRAYCGRFGMQGTSKDAELLARAHKIGAVPPRSRTPARVAAAPGLVEG